MKEFLSYVEDTTDSFVEKASSSLIKEIHKTVIEVKQSKEVEVEYMTLLQRDRENIELGREEGLELSIKILKFYSSGQSTAEIADKLELEKEYVQRLIDKYENL